MKVIRLLIVFPLLLTCCTTVQYPVKGIFRSKDPYYARGAWYYPQPYYDYDKIGIASWYGPRFHGEKKAQGESYNQFGMTAAHRTLPLPTIVKVTNLANNKSVIVLVDDRGPFKYKNRIIDLSASAAREIGLYNKGVGKVRVQSLPKESNAFSLYLKQHGRWGISKQMNWEALYRKEIGSKRGYQNLSKISSCFKDQTPEFRMVKPLLKKQKSKKYSNIMMIIEMNEKQFNRKKLK